MMSWGEVGVGSEAGGRPGTGNFSGWQEIARDPLGTAPSGQPDRRTIPMIDSSCAFILFWTMVLLPYIFMKYAVPIALSFLYRHWSDQ